MRVGALKFFVAGDMLISLNWLFRGVFETDVPLLVTFLISTKLEVLYFREGAKINQMAGFFLMEHRNFDMI